MVPFPQRRSSAEQYLSHPQQIRPGCLGFSAKFGFDLLILDRVWMAISSLTIFSDHGMVLFTGRGDQFQENFPGQVALPMVSQLCIADQTEEDNGYA